MIAGTPTNHYGLEPLVTSHCDHAWDQWSRMCPAYPSSIYGAFSIGPIDMKEAAVCVRDQFSIQSSPYSLEEKCGALNPVLEGPPAVISCGSVIYV